MNKTIFEAVKAWVMGLIGKANRRIDGVEKSIVKINQKLPNFLTRHSVVRNTPIRLENYSEMTGDWLYDEWKFKTEPDIEGQEYWFWIDGEVDGEAIQSINVYSDAGGPCLALEYDTAGIYVYRTNAYERYPAGWSYNERGDDTTFTPLDEPPTLILYSWNDDGLIDFLNAQAAFVKSEFEKYENQSSVWLGGFELNFVAADNNPSIGPYTAEIYSNGRGMFMESTRQSDGERSQIGVGPFGVKINVYGNEVLRFGTNGNKITGLDAPEDDTDAVPKWYADTHSVASFNGRTGTVMPQSGDYTAAQVGADEEGAAAAVQDNLDIVAALISPQATSQNKLVSASEMGDAISAVEAKQLYATNTQGSFATKAALLAATTFYNAGGTVATPTKNDVAYVLADESHSGKSAKYVIDEVVEGVITWGFVITFSDTTFSQAQMDAINSNITNTKRESYDSHIVNPNIHVTATEKAAWDAKAPGYQYSTTDLTAGSSPLATGTLYFVYE